LTEDISKLIENVDVQTVSELDILKSLQLKRKRSGVDAGLTESNDDAGVYAFFTKTQMHKKLHREVTK
jgi:hypothetical protein